MVASDVLGGGRLWSVEAADCEPWLASLPEGAVDLVICSPPYVDARTYGIGFKKKDEEWVAWMVRVVGACSRACRGLVAVVVEGRTRNYRYDCTPFLLMADLHRAGYHLRKPCVWHKNGMSGSGGPDWLRNDWEPVLCVTARPGRLPWSDNRACGRPPKFAPGGRMSHRLQDGKRIVTRPRDGQHSQESTRYRPPEVANPGNVIRAVVGGGRLGSPLAHDNEAPYPEALVEPFVLSFCPPGGVVCDPFAGSGTTGAVAVRLGRRFVGCDVRESQVELSRRRIAGVNPPLFTEEEE